MKRTTMTILAGVICFAGVAQARPAGGLQVECLVSDKSGSTPAAAEITSGQASRLDFKDSRYSAEASFDGSLLDGKSDLTISLIDSKDLKTATESLSLSATRVVVGTRLSSRHIKMKGSNAETIQVDCVVRKISL